MQGGIGTHNVIVVASQAALKDWKGANESDEESDYDSIVEFINPDEDGIVLFTSKSQYPVLTFFSMSSRIEIFQNQTGFLVCEGLYFNQDWDFETSFAITATGSPEIKLSYNEASISILDAVCDTTRIDFQDENVNPS